MSQDFRASVAPVVTVLVVCIQSAVSPPAVHKSNAKSQEDCYDKFPILLAHFLSIECPSTVIVLSSKVYPDVCIEISFGHQC